MQQGDQAAQLATVRQGQEPGEQPVTLRQNLLILQELC